MTKENTCIIRTVCPAHCITIVAEEDPAAFSLTETALRWRELEANFEAVVHGRLHGISGFGSCSFTEPRDDLAALGWI